MGTADCWASGGTERKETDYPALLQGKERCRHLLLKSSLNHLQVARPRAPGFAAPLGGDLDGLGTTGSTVPLGWRLLLRRGNGAAAGVALGDEQAEVLPAAEWMQQQDRHGRM